MHAVETNVYPFLSDFLLLLYIAASLGLGIGNWTISIIIESDMSSNCIASKLWAIPVNRRTSPCRSDNWLCLIDSCCHCLNQVAKVRS